MIRMMNSRNVTLLALALPLYLAPLSAHAVSWGNKAATPPPDMNVSAGVPAPALPLCAPNSTCAPAPVAAPAPKPVSKVAAKPLPPICEGTAQLVGGKCVCEGDGILVLVQVPGSRRQACAAPYPAAVEHVVQNIVRREMADSLTRLDKLEQIANVLCGGDRAKCESVLDQIIAAREQLQAHTAPGQQPSNATATATVNVDLTTLQGNLSRLESSLATLSGRVTDIEGVLADLCGQRRATVPWTEQCAGFAAYIAQLVMNNPLAKGPGVPVGPRRVELIGAVVFTGENRGGNPGALGGGTSFQISGTSALTGYLRLHVDLIEVRGLNVGLAASAGMQYSPSPFIDFRIGGTGGFALRPGYHGAPLTTLPLWHAGGEFGATVWFTRTRRVGLTGNVSLGYGQDNIMTNARGRNVTNSGLVVAGNGGLVVRFF